MCLYVPKPVFTCMLIYLSPKGICLCLNKVSRLVFTYNTRREREGEREGERERERERERGRERERTHQGDKLAVYLL